MLKQSSSRVEKVLAILQAVFLVVSMVAVAVSSRDSGMGKIVAVMMVAGAAMVVAIPIDRLGVDV